MGYNILFFIKNIFFFDFLFVLSKDSLIFASENRLKLFIIHYN